jgi:hypothetical protein
MLQTTTLKRNLVPEIGEARRVEGFGYLGYLGLGIWVATTLKRKFLLVVS